MSTKSIQGAAKTTIDSNGAERDNNESNRLLRKLMRWARKDDVRESASKKRVEDVRKLFADDESNK